MPPTNATRPSITIVFSWWQCSGRSCLSSTHAIRPARCSSSRTLRAVRRDGRNTGSGAPAQSSTRTSTRSASSASRFRSDDGVGCRPAITKSGDMNQPLRWTNAVARRISATMRASACSPSISTSSRLPSRGGGASSAQPPDAAASGCLPSLASRRVWWARTAAETVSPTQRSTPRPASRAGVTAASLCRHLDGRADRRRHDEQRRERVRGMEVLAEGEHADHHRDRRFQAREYPVRAGGEPA